jgi:hypothetical protein
MMKESIELIVRKRSNTYFLHQEVPIRSCRGATTFRITALSITTLSIMTLSIKGLLECSINDCQRKENLALFI